MMVFVFFLGIAAIVLLAFSLIWLFQSKGKREKMFNCFFLFLSLMAIFICIYECCRFTGFMRYAYICEIGAILCLFLLVIFFIRSLRFGKKSDKDIYKIMKDIERIDV